MKITEHNSDFYKLTITQSTFRDAELTFVKVKEELGLR